MLRKLLRLIGIVDKTETPHWKMTRLGFVLRTMGVATADELDRATAVAIESNRRLGDVLVDTKVISEDALTVALTLQKRMRNGDRGGAMLDIHEHRTQKHYVRLGLDAHHPA